MRWRTDTPALTPSLPVAPMLDMAFQILAFFILIYHPASSERAVPLYASDSTGNASQKESMVKPVIGIDIVADSSGGHAVVYRLRTEGRLDTSLCDLATLGDLLKNSKPGATVRIIAQAGIRMRDVVAVVDAAAAAGLTAITFGEPAAPSGVQR